MSEPKICMIAAVAENGVIGADQTIPWSIPSDTAYFRATTLGKPIVYGRKQYETIGRPLPKRTNILITRQADYRPEGVIVVATLEEGLEKARQAARAEGVDEIMVIGGGQIYALAMDLADRLYISHVAAAPAGDIIFPAIDPAIWQVVDEPHVEPNEKDSAAFRVRVYERRNARPD